MKAAWAGAALGAWALAAACSWGPAEAPLVRVNGEPITLGQVRREQAFMGEAGADADAVLEDLIDQALVLQEGRRLGARLSADDLRNAEAQALAGTDEALFEKGLQQRGLSLDDWRGRLAKAALMDQAIQAAVRRNLDVGRQEIQDHYWENLLAYRSPSRRQLRQIFTRNRSAAEAAERELELGEPFASVAQSRGQGPEAAQGGLIGPVVPAQWPKALAKKAAELKAGRRSGILASHWGYHILYCEAVLPAVALTLDEASPRAHARLLREKEQDQYRAWLARLRESAVIERLKPLPAPTPAPPIKGVP